MGLVFYYNDGGSDKLTLQKKNFFCQGGCSLNETIKCVGRWNTITYTYLSENNDKQKQQKKTPRRKQEVILYKKFDYKSHEKAIKK